ITITASAVTSGTALTVSQVIDTTSTANITLSADRMSLGAAVIAHTGIITLKPTTPGRPIDLGTNADTTHLGLLQTDLNNVTAAVLRSGDSNAGALTVTAAITDVGTGLSTLSLLSGGLISENGGNLQVARLAVQAGGGVDLGDANNRVGVLAGDA